MNQSRTSGRATAGRIAGALGKGLVAGLAGTAVMTAVQKIEMALTDREGSDTLAEAVEKVLGVRFADDASKRRASSLVHWAYGTALGGLRGLLDAVGLDNASGTAAHFGLVWGSELVGLPAAGLAPPPTEREAERIVQDAGHHAVYALAVGAVYTWLDGSKTRATGRA